MRSSRDAITATVCALDLFYTQLIMFQTAAGSSECDNGYCGSAGNINLSSAHKRLKITRYRKQVPSLSKRQTNLYLA